MIKSKQTAAVAAALVANCIFGFSNFFSVIALRHAQPMVVLSVRSTIAFLVLFLLWGMRVIKMNFHGKNLTGVLIMAIAQPLIYYICELYGIELTSSALSGVLVSLTPVAVIILSSIFLNERPNRLQVVFTAISVIGVIFINTLDKSNKSGKIIGIVVLLCAVIAAALFNILNRRESKVFSPTERTFVMFAVAATGFNCISLCMYKTKYFSMLKESFTEPGFCVAIVYLALVSSILAFLLYNYATSHIDVIKASSFSNIIPVVAILAGVVLLKENFNLYQVLFSALIILGVWGVNRYAK